MILPPAINRRLQDSLDYQITQADLDELETELPAQLPSGLRQLLLERNGGHFRHGMGFPVKHPTREVSGGCLHTLFGLAGYSDETDGDIRYRAGYYWRKGLPNWLVPFASSFCDPICFATSGSRRDAVIMWDLEGGISGDNLYRVADSFYEFLELLVIEDEGSYFSETVPILEDIERGRIEAVVDYLADGGNVECHNEEAHTLLMCAARTSWPDILELLLAHGASLQAVDGAGRGPLYYGVFNNSIDCVKLLLSAGADPNVRDKSGESVLDLAKRESNDRVARLLREHGAADGYPTALSDV